MTYAATQGHGIIWAQAAADPGYGQGHVWICGPGHSQGLH